MNIIFYYNTVGKLTNNMWDPTMSTEVTKFSVKFLNEVYKGKNLVCSPLSVEFLLGLVALGASDPSQTELLNALGLKDEQAIRSVFTEMTSELMSPKGVTLRSATRIFVKREPESELDPRFHQDATDVFDARIKLLDFEDGHTAAEHINKWVEKQTEDKITDICKPDYIDQFSTAIIFNALYFKGRSKKPFPLENTQEKPFKVNAERTINIPMMSFHTHRRLQCGFSVELEASLLLMPFDGEETGMLFILPKEVNGLRKLLKTLAEGFEIGGILKQLFYRRCSVTIPKFKIESEINLKEPLYEMGVKTIFNDSKSQINKVLKGGKPMCISKALQKAVIEVKEEGTDDIHPSVSARPANRPPLHFNADHPFLYIILATKHTVQNQNSLLPLLMGVFCGE